MRVTSLELTNLRAIETAKFQFQPRINLIAGVNGVGKSSVLDALRVSLSAVVKQANGLRSRVEAFTLDDIRVGSAMLLVQCNVQIGSTEHNYVIHKPRETNVPEKVAGKPRMQVVDTPAISSFLGYTSQIAMGNEPGGRPLAVIFSTNRAVPSDRAPRKGVASGGPAAAFGDAFAIRELQLGVITAWMRAQEALRSEHSLAARALVAVEEAVSRFLPEFSNLRVNDDGKSLLIDRGSSTVAVRQMSDGERGTLALVLDLTRRLFQANPEMDDPVAEAEVVVLIDEIDLHLHPVWQRQIVQKLTATFPNCQFIATTHSPQVIGEVEHNQIHIMSNGEVYSPAHSFGVDSSRVVEEIMDADPRTKEVQRALSDVSSEISKQQYDEARSRLTELVDRLGENDPEIIRIATLLDFLEGKE